MKKKKPKRKPRTPITPQWIVVCGEAYRPMMIAHGPFLTADNAARFAERAMGGTGFVLMKILSPLTRLMADGSRESI